MRAPEIFDSLKKLCHSSATAKSKSDRISSVTASRCHHCSEKKLRCVCDHTNLEARQASYGPQIDYQGSWVKDHTNANAWSKVFH
ncbi:hypothetical protein IV203_021473 [Nitzschia inconspicua]|uniref:Uncharacterized protein n=1 Tax=Nitzschia inconspicua TaxID=303405 RepID=A0A9K3PDH5_9STRA|nr:hypothetical protein IV203_021473 [Nitzschia inconspicua]